MEVFLDFLKLFITTWWGIAILVLVGLLIIVLLYRPFFKAFFDCFLAFIGLVILSPVFLIIAILVKKSSPGAVFFRQQRIGKNKKLFTIHKFRTMRTDTPKDCPTHMLANADAYITKIGKFLRKTSLDELPQIWDIFRLKMSIIGPRPALYNQDDLVAERDKYGANNIRPGLTGLAQVSGRDELEIPVKAKLDGDYKKRRNVFLDIKIFFLTILKVFDHDGVKEGGTGAINAEKQSQQLKQEITTQEEQEQFKKERQNITPLAELLKTQEVSATQTEITFDEASIIIHQPSKDSENNQGGTK